jgi:hypothetical protein
VKALQNPGQWQSDAGEVLTFVLSKIAGDPEFKATKTVEVVEYTCPKGCKIAPQRTQSYGVLPIGGINAKDDTSEVLVPFVQLAQMEPNVNDETVLHLRFI